MGPRFFWDLGLRKKFDVSSPCFLSPMSWLAQAKKNDKPVPMTTKCFGKIAPFALMGK